MRVNKVTASAFGPLVDQSLSFAPGMTVIVGDNESAKSTWHAAVYAAMCGRRRGKGAPPKDERRFADLHRPWDHDKWAVSANITLDDARTIEMYQDLDGKVDCRARDMGLGAVDVSDGIIFEGSPDASRWLGLDRRSFASTACINQAELLKVLTDADGLQEHLQRAAATAGTTDVTAAAALARLVAFSRDHVGTNQANSTKPLRQAKNAVDHTGADLAGAVAAHGQYLDLVTGADAAHRLAHASAAAVTALVGQLAAVEGLAGAARACTAATADVARLSERAGALTADLATANDALTQARALDAQFAGHAPAGTPADEQDAQLVAASLAGYRALAPVAELAGPSSDQLAATLAALPQAPRGDTAVAGQVRTAAAGYAQCIAMLTAHEADRPAALPELTPDQVAAAAVGPDLLRELAGALSAPVPALDPALAGAVTAAAGQVAEATTALTAAQNPAAHPASGQSPEQARSGSGGRVGTIVAGAGAVVTVLALVAFATGAAPAGALMLVLGLLTAGAGVFLRAKAAPARSLPGHPGLEPELVAAARERLLGARTSAAGAAARLEAALSVVEAARAAAGAVAARAVALHLTSDPDQLKALAAGVEHRAVARQASAAWDARQATAQGATDVALGALVAALDDRGAAPEPDPSSRYERYEADCGQRAQVAAQAARRDQLVLDHDARVLAEQGSQAGHARAATALDGLRRAAAAVLPGEHDGSAGEVLASLLGDWQGQRTGDLSATEAAQAGWAQLGALLGRKTLTDLEAGEADLSARAAGAVVDLAGAQLAAAGAAQARALALTALPAEMVTPANNADNTADPSNESMEQLAAAALTAVGTALAAARESATNTGASAADADGTLRERARALPSVAEAEERVQVAQTELARVLELEATLSATRDFLDAAQQRAHRDIAPVLAATLTAWLPAITGGRYVEAAVDPRTLQVQVWGPSRNPRSADRLSRGTAEQVYLLLRVALARHLVTAGTTCPLLLDDVTVQADSKRTEAILNLLHELSKDQQVIVFAQEALVADWARATLTSPADAVVEIAEVPWS